MSPTNALSTFPICPDHPLPLRLTITVDRDLDTVADTVAIRFESGVFASGNDR